MTLAHESLRCPGMNDLSPEEMARFRLIERTFSETCARWGFREIRTPVIEHLHLFTSAGTLSPQMLGRVYSFLDWDGWSGERVVLRPDGTIPAARLYWERYRDEIAKLYYVENIFRFAPPDERREVWQCGAELIGDVWPLGDLEVIEIVRAVLRQLGFPSPALRLSHTGIVRAVLATAGYSEEEQLALYDRVIEGDLGVFGEIDRRLPQAGAPLEMLRGLIGGRVDGLENLRSAFAASLPRIQQPLDELRTIAAALEAVGCPYELDLTMVRGFEYYTGPVFQVLIGGQNVAGGGRYDGLVSSQEGHSVPACGFAISVEPLLSLLSETAVAAEPAMVEVRPAGSSPEAVATALEAVSDLHRLGHAAELIAAGRSPRARLRLIADGEAGRRSYTLEDRERGETRQVETLQSLAGLLDGGKLS
jgi:histidyl-tRNA synthetase